MLEYKIVEETRGEKREKKKIDANDEIFYLEKLNIPGKFYIIPNIWFLFYLNVSLERLIIYETRKYNRRIDIIIINISMIKM